MNMKEKFSLLGKTALICGASQGIGEASAIVLAEAGAQVFVLARRKEELDRLVVSLPKHEQFKAKHQAIVCDLGKSADIEAALKPHLGFDIIVHNVAGPKAGPLIGAEQDELAAAISLHLFSAQKILQLSFPHMKNKQWGRVINIISTSVKAPINNLGVSNTVRGAMASWSKTMANELGMYGITVNNVLPGYTRTPRFEALKKNTAEGKNISEAAVETAWIEATPVKRIAEPKEIAAAVLFLASTEASYVNGINLPVDGGRTQSL